MVANLTRFFVRRLLWKKPEAMVGTMGYDTVEAVRQHAEELCVMAYECGVYHDIGKSMVTMYVGNNSRRLLEEEFVCVQWHAAFGYELLCKIATKATWRWRHSTIIRIMTAREATRKISRPARRT